MDARDALDRYAEALDALRETGVITEKRAESLYSDMRTLYLKRLAR